MSQMNPNWWLLYQGRIWLLPMPRTSSVKGKDNSKLDQKSSNPNDVLGVGLNSVLSFGLDLLFNGCLATFCPNS